MDGFRGGSVFKIFCQIWIFLYDLLQSWLDELNGVEKVTIPLKTGSPFERLRSLVVVRGTTVTIPLKTGSPFEHKDVNNSTSESISESISESQSL